MTTAGRYQRYRAPQTDGEILCAPAWRHIQALLHTNQEQRSAHRTDIGGRPFAVLATQARSEMLEAALRYTRTYTEAAEQQSPDAPLILTGHQSGLVHPGVWLKNFAAAKLAQDCHGISVKLIIDSDLCRNTSIQIPTGTVQDPRLKTVAYDLSLKKLPYEEREIADRATWKSFGTRATDAISSFVDKPLLYGWWTEYMTRSTVTNNLGLALAQARHRLEQRWGIHNLEIPQSLVCQTESFRRFVVFLLQGAERFRWAHNEALAEYRQAHRLRNPAQPMPDLKEKQGWLETPLWTWKSNQPIRRALYVRKQRNKLLISDLTDWHDSLPSNSSSAIERLATWQQQGIKIRSRALTTTLFARLLLADLFIHGIGGAKYDQVTDHICERLLGLSLPSHITISGTLKLPIEHPAIAPDQVPELRQHLRELKYHPELHCNDLPIDTSEQQQLEAWIAKKQAWVQTPQTPANAAERHQGIVAANAALQKWVTPRRTETQQVLNNTIQQSRANRILESREYPFCLFPPEQLRNFLLDF